MVQKHYLDIERIRFDNDLRDNNIEGFQFGDHIQITEKIDGSNASVRYDKGSGKLVGFSRKHELSEKMDLNGFYEYVKTLDPEPFKEHPDYVVFGEWLTKHTVKYDQEQYNKWYVYDIYDTAGCGYLPQTDVKAFCKDAGLVHVHVLYDGPFTEWSDIIQFAACPSAYGARQMEGIVIKDQDKLNEPDERKPFMVKYVNEAFSETKQHKNRAHKAKGSEAHPEQFAAEELASIIVTERRVEKELQKMQEEDLLPAKISPKDMGMIAKTLPDRIKTDCLKEEPETVDAAGAYFDASCRKLTMDYARKLILG